MVVRHRYAVVMPLQELASNVQPKAASRLPLPGVERLEYVWFILWIDAGPTVRKDQVPRSPSTVTRISRAADSTVSNQ